MNIKIVIEDKIATAPDNAVIVCGNNDYVITFLFDEDWDGYEAKTARFTYIKNGKSIFIDEPFVGDTCPVPMLSNVSRVDIGVYAGDLRTTTAAVVKCKKSILCKGGTPDEPDEDVYRKIMEMINTKLIDPNTPVDQVFNPESENPQSGKALGPILANIGNGSYSRISYVTLLSSAWEGEGNLYSQIVTIDGVTKNSQVDLTPSVEQLAIFYNKDLTLTTENRGGVVTVYAIGQKPQNDYTIQVTLTEVLR